MEKKKANENDDLKNMEIDAFINYCTINKYKPKERISSPKNFDLIQVNNKFIAGATKNALFIYSKQI